MAGLRCALPSLLLALLLPGAAAASTDGSSCTHPLRWHLSGSQTAAIDSWQSHHYVHGPVTVSIDGGDPYGGAILRAQAGGPWRICSVRGIYRDHHSWAMLGTIGSAAQPSFAVRRFNRSSPTSPSYVVIAYAHPTASDGTSCAHPAMVYERFGTDGLGDAGARIRTTTVNPSGLTTMTAQWQVAHGAHVCRVAGWSSHGSAWHVTGGGDGRHVMYADRPIGNHDNSVLYLWIAFRR